MQNLAQKINFAVKFEGPENDTKCLVDVLTGPFNDEAELEIRNAIDNLLGYRADPGWFTWLGWAGAKVWEQVKEQVNLSTDEPYVSSSLLSGLTVTITQVEPFAEFDPMGCARCQPGVGNDVTECFEYDDANKIAGGEYRDVKVCNDCLYTHHYGETA